MGNARLRAEHETFGWEAGGAKKCRERETKPCACRQRLYDSVYHSKGKKTTACARLANYGVAAYLSINGGATPEKQELKEETLEYCDKALHPPHSRNGVSREKGVNTTGSEGNVP